MDSELVAARERIRELEAEVARLTPLAKCEHGVPWPEDCAQCQADDRALDSRRDEHYRVQLVLLHIGAFVLRARGKIVRSRYPYRLSAQHRLRQPRKALVEDREAGQLLFGHAGGGIDSLGRPVVVDPEAGRPTNLVGEDHAFELEERTQVFQQDAERFV